MVGVVPNPKPLWLLIAWLCRYVREGRGFAKGWDVGLALYPYTLKIWVGLVRVVSG